MAQRAIVAANASSRVKVIGVARFSNPAHQKELEHLGIKTLRADLLDQTQLDALPDAPNVLYMPAMKFGSTGQEALTWAMNTALADKVLSVFQVEDRRLLDRQRVRPVARFRRGIDGDRDARCEGRLRTKLPGSRADV
jgi:hypothetical protein